MQTSRSKNVSVSIFLISLLLMSTLAFAAASQVSINPTKTSPETFTWFAIAVKNSGSDGITSFQVTVPQQNNAPTFSIKELSDPQGWTHELRYGISQSYPFMVIWSTSGSGIEPGKALQFNINAKSPDSVGDYSFDWMTSDTRGAKESGMVKVSNFASMLSGFGVSSQAGVTAGKTFQITVTSLDQNGDKQADYSGRVKFSSSDSMAVLPVDYTFTSTDAGVKAFSMKLKTVGTQQVTISDGSLEKKLSFNVVQGEVASLHVGLDKDTATPGSDVTVTVDAFDIYGNKNDVTKGSKFDIDSQARGKFASNVYKTEVEGKWTVIASYVSNSRIILGGTPLTVSSSAQPVIVQQNQSNMTEPKPSLEIKTEKSIDVPSNSTRTFDVIVKNTGDKDVKNVGLYFTGYSDKLVSIEPSSHNIAKGETKTFTVDITGGNQSSSDLELVVLSNEYSSDKLNASSSVKVNVVASIPSVQISPQTGKVSLNKNFTYLGIAIVIAVVLIVLFWALFLREEDKGKKPE